MFRNCSDQFGEIFCLLLVVFAQGQVNEALIKKTVSLILRPNKIPEQMTSNRRMEHVEIS